MANVPPDPRPPGPPPPGPPPPNPPLPEFSPPTSPGPAPIPTSVKAVRVMLWILVGAAALLLVAGLILAQDAYQVGQLTAAPIIIGVPALVLALLSTRRRKGVWVGLVVFESLMILMSLGQLSSQGGRTLITLAIHITILVLATRRSARDYYRGASDARSPRPQPDPYQQ